MRVFVALTTLAALFLYGLLTIVYVYGVVSAFAVNVFLGLVSLIPFVEVVQGLSMFVNYNIAQHVMAAL